MIFNRRIHSVRTSRRSVLKTGLAAVGMVGIGASGSGHAAATGATNAGDTRRPVVGHADDGLTTLNPFEARSRASGGSGPSVVLDAVYDRGVRFHPETNEPVPGVVESTDVRPENVGTNDPALVATVSDGYSWHDGEPVTAEDVAFTVEYVLDQQAGNGFIAPGGFERVSDVRVSGDRVEYVLDEPEPAWLERILGRPILPEHVWSDVADATARRPHEEGGPVGSGAFEVASVEFPDDSFERSVTLSARDDYPVPDFLDTGGPFVDGLRVEYYDSADALADGLFAGSVDVPSLATSDLFVDEAVTARSREDFSVAVNPSQFITVTGFNLRRVPFDDRAFRQFLTRAWDDRFHVEESIAGFAMDGDYATAPARRNYRPAEPEAPEAEQFPFFDDGTGSLDVEAARDFLRNADGVHDYTFGSVESDLVTGDAEIRVDGERLTAAHTDNDDTGGQGPLVFLTSAGEADSARDASWHRWVDVLRKVGVPTRRGDLSFADQIDRVFNRESFDVFEIGLNTGHPQLTNLDLFFGAENADLPSRDDRLHFNPMGYVGAEGPLGRMETMDRAAREDAGKDALRTIYEDCPVNVVDYGPKLQPIPDEWTGLVDAIRGVDNYFTWLSIRPSVVEVSIDVKPGSDRNPVNPDQRGLIPVAVLHTDDFDPSRVDVASLRFGPPDVVENGDGAAAAHGGHREDVDGDGDADLVVHFSATDAGFEDGDGTAVLTGRTTDGREIRGTDAVTVVGGGRGSSPSGGRSGGRGNGGTGSSDSGDNGDNAGGGNGGGNAGSESGGNSGGNADSASGGNSGGGSGNSGGGGTAGDGTAGRGTSGTAGGGSAGGRGRSAGNGPP